MGSLNMGVGGGGGGGEETQEVGFLLRPSSESKAQIKGEAWSWPCACEASEWKGALEGPVPWLLNDIDRAI